MAKSLLSGYRIGADVIDQVSGKDKIDQALKDLGESLQSSGVTTPEPEPQAPPPAEIEPDASAPGALVPEREGMFLSFTLNPITYRLGGVKALFVTSLRVNIRASEGESSYYDSLDLYSAKARSSFASALHRSWGADPARVERDLVKILEALEKDRDRQLAASSTKPKVEITEADKVLGLDLLRDKNLFCRIEDDLSALGYVGEELNKRLLYLCASSRKLDDPISVMILSQSASGKSYLVDCVRRLMPPEDVVAVTSLSDQALNYIEDLKHKFLVLGEAVHGDVVEHQIREMLSGKELSRLVTVKDPETGKMVSQMMRTPVIVASVMSGTNHGINPENASRAFLVNTDESSGQTAKIHERQRLRYSLDRLKTGKSGLEKIIRSHQAAQRLLRKLPVVNEFAPLLDFPTTLMRLRRDHDRFLDLIAVVAYLRQYQKPLQRLEGQEYIPCDLEDYRVAYGIMVNGVMASTVREIPKGALALYDQIKVWAVGEAKRDGVKWEEVGFTQRQVREVSGLGHTWVKQNLRILLDYEYISLASGGGLRTRGYYRLREGSQEDMVLKLIPTPEVMAARLKGVHR